MAQPVTTYEHGLPAGTVLGYECAVHHHDDWVPQQRHHVWPKGLGGPSTPANLITICPNGHYAIHSYLDMLIRSGGKPDPAVARHYGAKVRQYAERGWDEAGRPVHGGGE